MLAHRDLKDDSLAGLRKVLDEPLAAAGVGRASEIAPSGQEDFVLDQATEKALAEKLAPLQEKLDINLNDTDDTANANISQDHIELS